MADTGASGMTHFTLPALISSCAILQRLRECVSITGGAPPWSWRARRAATRMYRYLLSKPAINFIGFSPASLPAGGSSSEGLQNRPQSFANSVEPEYFGARAQ